LICAGVGVAVVLYLTRPRARKTRPVRPAPLVETGELRLTSEPVTIEAYGTVVAAKQLTLQAEVQGRIIYLDPNLVPGGLISADRKLLQIDPEDYKLEIKQRHADVAEARFEMEVEQGRKVIAKREWQLLQDKIPTSDAGRRLALRLPHEKRAAAKVEAAESLLDLAELNEKRTTLTCPFNAMVLSESVEVSQLVGRQDKLATLIGTDQFWVQVSVPLGKLPRISFRQADKPGSVAKVALDTANGAPIVRHGRVLRLLGDLNPSGRMARILVAIDNPLDLTDSPEAASASPRTMKTAANCILLGCYVKVEIDAGVQENVYVIPRETLREGSRLWLVNGKKKPKKLIFRNVRVLWRRRDEVLVQCDIHPDEKLVLSRLSAPLAGDPLRLHAPATRPGPRTRTAEGK